MSGFFEVGSPGKGGTEAGPTADAESERAAVVFMELILHCYS